MPSQDEHGLKPPPLIHRPMTASSTATSRLSQINRASSYRASHPDVSVEQETSQHFVLADFVAFRYLEADPGTTVVERRAELTGYQCFVVEQWATSRSHPTFVITAHTGEQSHKITVGVLSVPTDESVWSSRLRVYFRDLNQYNAKRQKTPLGLMMVTNLAGFPPSLTLIAIPNDDVVSWRARFYVNENLKRLGCLGRVGLSLAPPAASTIAKFHQIYHTSEKIDSEDSVIELVRLCQLALVIFDKLTIEYIDGLLCDVTEKAINDWWRDIGVQHYNIAPQDGILGPTTIAGLLGLLMGARNRLHALGTPVAKDAFDVEATMKAVGAFQKSQNVPRTRRLDHCTLGPLLRATQKYVENGGWGVGRAVKSKFVEFGGKGGEMVVDAVGRRDRASLADIETCDLELFIHLIYGEMPKWLWLGKPLKHSKIVGLASVEVLETFRDEAHNLESPNGDHGEDHDAADRPGSKHSRDGRRGIGRLKDAVGLGGSRQHDRQSSKDGFSPSSPRSPEATFGSARQNVVSSQTQRTSHGPRASIGSLTASEKDGSVTSPAKSLKMLAINNNADSRYGAAYSQSRQDLFVDSNDSLPFSNSSAHPDGNRGSGSLALGLERSNEPRLSVDSGRSSIGPNNEARDSVEFSGAASTSTSSYDDVEAEEKSSTDPKAKKDAARLLLRPASLNRLSTKSVGDQFENRYARSLSFSIAEESILVWTSVVDEDYTSPADIGLDDLNEHLARQDFLAAANKRYRQTIDDINASLVPWIETQLETLGSLVDGFQGIENSFHEMQLPRTERVDKLRTNAEGAVHQAKQRLQEGVKGIEMLVAKLDYEISGLKGRLEDVGAGVRDFEKGVQRVERRVRELELEQETRENGWRCLVM